MGFFALSVSTATQVLASRDRLKMLWVHASRFAAKMVQIQPGRYGPDKRLESETVRQHVSPAVPELSIPIT
jgi:hypothetical protein